MAADADDIIKMNRLINCIDVGKDATVPGGVLTNEKHGKFIRENVIEPLFHISQLSDKDKGAVKGVGDNKEYLIKKIETNARLRDNSYQEIPRLRFDANGNDKRFDGFFAAQDAGLGPDKLFSSYTLVLTPGGILDPADRSDHKAGMIDGLSKASIIKEDILKELDIADTLKEIKYNGRKGDNYPFEFVFSGGSKTFNLKKHRDDEGMPLYFKGNPIKNTFIRDNYKNNEMLTEIMYYVLMKELGDTLQVMWLKQLRDTPVLGITSRAKTVLCTCDKAVWLRCIINDVSCVLTDGSLGKWYPVNESEEAAAAQQVIIKATLRENVEKTNNQVIDDLYNLLNNKNGYTYVEKDLSRENLDALNLILNSLLHKLLEASRDINRSLEISPVDVSLYRTLCANHTFINPFIIRTDTVNPRASFKAVLPRATITSKIELKIDKITTAIQWRKPITPELIKSILGDIPVNLLALPGWLQPQPKPKKVIPAKVGLTAAENQAIEILFGLREANASLGGGESRDFFIKNIDKPGFLTYYLTSYVPEVLFIGISYSRMIHNKLYTKLSKLLSVPHLSNISNLFGTTYDSSIEYNTPEDGKFISEYDELSKVVCIIASKALKYIQEHPEVKESNIFDVATDNIIEFCHLFTDIPAFPHIDKLMETPKEGFHFSAMNIYQSLYDAEVYLITHNLRDKRTPVELLLFSRLKKIRTLKAARNIKRANVSINNLNTNSRSVNRNTKRRRKMNSKNSSVPQISTPEKLRSGQSSSVSNNNTPGISPGKLLPKGPTYAAGPGFGVAGSKRRLVF